MVMGKVPACKGIPLIIWVEDVRDRPWGRLPLVMDHTYGVDPPLPARETE